MAGLVLLVAYVGLSFLNDPHGYLGTDTGGKVATLEAMDRSSSFDPDVGYWAKQWDPEATYHALYNTTRIDDRYLNVTSLPMVLAAEPLYRLGGYRLALLLPMLGSIAAAFAARAIAERLRPGRGWPAFWLTGLAGTMTIYAVDFWEHSIGAALMAWGVVAVLDATRDRAVLRKGVFAGLLFGAAFTMRTEAAVYALVAIGVGCIALLVRDRKVVEPIKLGGAAVVGAAIPILLNIGLEIAVVGHSMRTSRAAGAASGGGDTLSFRVREGLTTTFSFSGGDNSAIMVGAFALVLLAYAVIKAPRDRPIKDGPIVIATAGLVALLYLLDFRQSGYGFVPGLVPTTPFVALAVVFAWRSDVGRIAATVALVALPLVWVFEFSGGAGPQWGGRYVLTSAVVLGAIGLAHLDLVDRRVVGVVCALAVFVTFIGAHWLSIRSHGIDAARRDVAARSEPVLISESAFWLREMGSEALDHRWLSARDPASVGGAATIVRDAGLTEFGLLGTNGQAAPSGVDDWQRGRTDHYTWLGVDFTITTYDLRSTTP
ncbi:MAG: hypothetical protein QOE63_1165 [Acidimicrobiaceae bacterium]